MVRLYVSDFSNQSDVRIFFVHFVAVGRKTKKRATIVNMREKMHAKQVEAFFEFRLITSVPLMLLIITGRTIFQIQHLHVGLAFNCDAP